MNEKQSLLAAILSNPSDDLPRLILADYLDENGESERAEFIRVQLQLARPKMDCHHARPPLAVPWCNVCQLRNREYELARASSGWPPDWLMKFDRDSFPYEYERQAAYVGRGFIRRLRCSWDNWLKAAESLYWHPSQTVVCPACGGDGWIRTYCCYACGKPEDQGTRKMGAGRIARPCLLTAQPLEMVELTDRHEYIVSAAQFTRLKCETCGGAGYVCECDPDGCETCFCSDDPCPDCHGEPLNRWTCPLWPSVVFVMPEMAYEQPMQYAPSQGWRYERQTIQLPDGSIEPMLGVSLLWEGHREDFHDGLPVLGERFHIDQPDLIADAILHDIDQEVTTRSIRVTLRARSTAAFIFRT